MPEVRGNRGEGAAIEILKTNTASALESCGLAGFDDAGPHRHCAPPMSNPDFEAARLTVRLGAIVNNYRVCQRLAAPAMVSGVVKADAYGMGMAPCAKALAEAG